MGAAAGLAIFFWSAEGYGDDNDFQGHPAGVPFSAEQQAQDQIYQIVWSIALALGIGGTVAIVYAVRKR